MTADDKHARAPLFSENRNNKQHNNQTLGRSCSSPTLWLRERSGAGGLARTERGREQCAQRHKRQRREHLVENADIVNLFIRVVRDGLRPPYTPAGPRMARFPEQHVPPEQQQQEQRAGRRRGRARRTTEGRGSLAEALRCSLAADTCS